MNLARTFGRARARLAVATVAWAALAAASAGCAGTAATSRGVPSRPAAGPGPPAAAHSRRSPSPDPAVVAGQAFVGRTNLVASDLAGWQPSSDQPAGADSGLAARLEACAGSTRPAPKPASPPAKSAQKAVLAQGASANFARGYMELSSQVTVLARPKFADQDLKALRSRQATACVQKVAVPYLQSQLPAGDRLGAVFIRPLTPPKPAAGKGPKETYGYRITVPVSDPDVGTVTVFNDALGFVIDGATEVELDLTKVGAPPPPEVENPLYLQLLTKATAAQKAATQKATTQKATA